MSRVTNYDALADGYNVRYRNCDYTQIKEGLTDFLGAEPLGAVLEVGCGTGYWLTWLAGRASTVAGVDLSASMIAQAKDSGAALARARAESLPWRDASFDRVLCINALHHFADRDAFFDEARRVLKPNGAAMAIGLDPHAGRDSWWIYEYFPETVAIDLARYPAVRTIRAELVRAGFTSSESYEVQMFEHLMPATQALERGLVTPSFTSQLAVLSAEELDAGMARLRAAIAEAEKSGGELMLASELHFYAVIGRLTAS